MDSAVTIRPAREQDSDRIHELVRAEKLNPTGLDWTRFLVAEDRQGIVVGCGQIKPHRDGTLEMASIVIEEELRGKGLGRRLIERLIDGVHQPLWLMCRSSLVPLYEQFGFEEVDADAQQPAYFRRVRRLASVYHFLKGTGEYLAVMCRPTAQKQAEEDGDSPVAG